QVAVSGVLVKELRIGPVQRGLVERRQRSERAAGGGVAQGAGRVANAVPGIELAGRQEEIPRIIVSVGVPLDPFLVEADGVEVVRAAKAQIVDGLEYVALRAGDGAEAERAAFGIGTR